MMNLGVPLQDVIAPVDVAPARCCDGQSWARSRPAPSPDVAVFELQSVASPSSTAGRREIIGESTARVRVGPSERARSSTTRAGSASRLWRERAALLVSLRPGLVSQREIAPIVTLSAAKSPSFHSSFARAGIVRTLRPAGLRMTKALNAKSRSNTSDLVLHRLGEQPSRPNRGGVDRRVSGVPHRRDELAVLREDRLSHYLPRR